MHGWDRTSLDSGLGWRSSPRGFITENVIGMAITTVRLGSALKITVRVPHGDYWTIVQFTAGTNGF